jgi:hypothetical protein
VNPPQIIVAKGRNNYYIWLNAGKWQYFRYVGDATYDISESPASAKQWCSSPRCSTAPHSKSTLTANRAALGFLIRQPMNHLSPTVTSLSAEPAMQATAVSSAEESTRCASIAL